MMYKPQSAVDERAPDPRSSDPPDGEIEQLRDTIAETAIAAGDLGCNMADIAGTIDDVRRLAKSQTEVFAKVGADVGAVTRANERMLAEARSTAETARATRIRVEQSLGAAVTQIETGLTSVGRSLGEAIDATNEIAQVAAQTRMVALNAAVEAARAGTEGNSFAVVAAAVRDLAQSIQSSSRTIAGKLGDLSATIGTLASRAPASSGLATEGLRASVDQALETFRQDFDEVARRIEGIAASAEQNVTDGGRVDSSVHAMAAEVASIENSVGAAARKSERLLGISEQLIEATANSGARTDDTPFIECALMVGAEMSDSLVAALGRREIDMAGLFDEQYRPVRGTNPPQFLTRFVELTDRLFTPIQEDVLQWSGRVTFCAAVDRNGFLPTHNLKYSKPQRADATWNMANCRNRRLFQDRAGAAAGRNAKPFLVQTYRRDMGGGQFAILKEVDVPIHVGSRLWGNVRLAYRPVRT